MHMFAGWHNRSVMLFFSPDLIVTVATRTTPRLSHQNLSATPRLPMVEGSLALSAVMGTDYFPGHLAFTHPVLSLPGSLSVFCFAVAASTPNSTAGAAMNSLTSLGTLQGLAGATVGLNNINALAGTIAVSICCSGGQPPPRFPTDSGQPETT